MSAFPPRALCELTGERLDGLRIEMRLAENPSKAISGGNPETPLGPAHAYRVSRLGPTEGGRDVRRRYAPGVIPPPTAPG